jgi:hypothetical protein
MGSFGRLLLFAWAANLLMASDLGLCVANPARLDDSTVGVFQKELGAILVASGRPAVFKPCQPGLVRITLRRRPPAEEPAALGATRYKDGRLIPEIEIFITPTTHMIDTSLPSLLGLAMARVATHELGHWLSQSQRHSPRGIMMARLSAAYLIAPDCGYFRLPPGE